MSTTLSNLGFRSSAATGKTNITLTFPTEKVAEMVIQPDSSSIDNKYAVPVMTDSTGRVIKRSRISDDEMVVSIETDDLTVSGHTTVNYLTTSTGAQFGPPESGYDYPAARGVLGQAMLLGEDGAMEWEDVTTAEVHGVLKDRVTVTEGELTSLESRTEQLEAKTSYIATPGPAIVTEFTSAIDCKELICQGDISFSGELRGESWVSTTDTQISISAPNGGISLSGNVVTTDDIICQQRVKSTNGLQVGAVPTEYLFPTARGVTGQGLILGAAGAVNWTSVPSLSQVTTLEGKTTTLESKTQYLTASPGGSAFSSAVAVEGSLTVKNTALSTSYALPVAGPSGSNFTLVSTNNVGTLEWLSPSFYRAYRLDTINGVNTVFSAPNEFSVFPYLNLSSSLGFFTASATGVTYTGTAAQRTCYATFSMTVQNENKGAVPDVQLIMRNTTTGITQAHTIFEANDGAQQQWTVSAVTTLSTGQVLNVVIKPSIACTLRLISPNFSIVMM